MTRLSLAELTPKQIRQFAKVFLRYAKDERASLTSPAHGPVRMRGSPPMTPKGRKARGSGLGLSPSMTPPGDGPFSATRRRSSVGLDPGSPPFSADSPSRHITLEDLKGKVLDIDGLGALMEEFGHPEERVRLRRLIAEWSTTGSAHVGRAVDFPAFCSMLANILKLEQLDEQVEKDWSKFVGDGGDLLTSLVRASDIRREVPFISVQEAREMIYEADSENRGGITFADLLDTLTTVWDSEVTLHSSDTVKLEELELHSLHASITPEEFRPISSLVKREKVNLGGGGGGPAPAGAPGGAVGSGKAVSGAQQSALNTGRRRNSREGDDGKEQLSLIVDDEAVIIV